LTLSICKDARLQVKSLSKARARATKSANFQQPCHIIYDFEVDDNGCLYVEDLRLLFSAAAISGGKKKVKSLGHTIGKRLVKYFNRKDTEGLASLFLEDARIELPGGQCNAFCLYESLELSAMKLKAVYESQTCASLHLSVKPKGSKSFVPCILFVESSQNEKISRASFCFELEHEI